MPEEQVVRMSVAGWTFLAISWLTITGIMVFCINRVIESGKHVETRETPL